MTPVVACVVCARPFDSLLTSGLHAGVSVMALAAVVIIGALVRGALAVVRQDAALAREAETAATPEVAS
jgi:hypothetical protein